MARRNNSHNNHKMVSARDIMKRYQLSYQSVNHYTDIGLLPVSVKRGNIRYYNSTLIGKRLRKIRELMDEGYSLRLIRKKIIGI